MKLFRLINLLFNNFIERTELMSLADTILKMAADIEAIKAAPAPTVTVDQSEVLAAVADIKTDTAAIKADLTPTA